MVFQDPSTRPRVSFEVGMYQLGGHALHLLPQEIQIGQRETPSDTGRVLARYIHAIMVRPFDHSDRKSTRLNSSHANISYAVFCLKPKVGRIPPAGVVREHGAAR